MKSKPVEFQPPAGVVPEGLGAGEEFDAVSTYRIKSNGTICLVMLGDAKMPGYEAKESRGAKPSYREDAQSMVDAREE